MRRLLYGWLTAQALSITGTRVSMIAIPLYVLEQTGSATKTGLAALAETLPLVVFKVLAGPVIDRCGARSVAIACDTASLFVVALIPLLHSTGVMSFPVFLALVALAGALRGPGDGARDVLAPTVAEAAGVPMERVTGLDATVERTASMLGAGLAGLLVATMGAQNALLIDAASFGLSALVLGWATAGMGAGQLPESDAAPYFVQLKEGWDFLRADRLLLGITVMVAITNLLDIAWASVLMPVWSVESGEGAAVLGLVFAVFSGSSALGAVCAAIWGARLPRLKTYLFAFLLCGLPRFAIFVVDSPVAGVLAIFVVGGFASGFINPVLGAVMFERIPDHLRGRVTSLSTAMCFALMPLGGLLGGLLVDSWNLGAAMGVCGAAYFVATMLPAVDSRWREMDRRPAAEQVSA